jgi:hypothetical protein
MILVLCISLGMLLALLHPVLSILYGVGIGSYILMSGVSAFMITSTADKKHLKALEIMTVFWILHVGYGCGYLKGVWQFVVLNKKPSEQEKELSR